MSLLITHPEADILAHALAERTGESVEQAVMESLRERLARTPQRVEGRHSTGRLLAIGMECASLPDYDLRSADEILGYDDSGAPR